MASCPAPSRSPTRCSTSTRYLGCYYVVCVDTSDLVNFMLDDMGAAHWMDAVEELSRKSIRSFARREISLTTAASRNRAHAEAEEVAGFQI